MTVYIGGPQDTKQVPEAEKLKENENPRGFSRQQTIDGKPVECLYALDPIGNYFFLGVVHE